MAEIRYLDEDIIRLYALKDGKKSDELIATLFWGDNVTVTGKLDGQHVVELWRRYWSETTKHYVWRRHEGVLPAKTRFRSTSLLKVRFLDVGQGDATIVETPNGRVLLIDGGEGEHLRRYINVAYSHILRTQPLPCEAIVVTHGDADHFAGLTELAEGMRSKTSPLITTARVFHNGLVKKTDDSIKDAFGSTAKVGGITYATQLEDDLLAVPDTRMNRPFKAWKRGLQKLKAHTSNLMIHRLEYGEDSAFAFLDAEDIDMRVLGPITETVQGSPALRFLRVPGSSSLSVAHTINGHSVVLKLAYHNVRFLFGADLNEESEERLLVAARNDGISLSAEVLKVPHHGSADFSPAMLEAVRPVVSVVSSGDETTAKDYIHPRAGLVGALGKYSRASVDRPLVYCTEMVAFFERLGDVRVDGAGKMTDGRKTFANIHNAYRKSVFGIVHVRTDGERVLVATHSARDDQKESYAFRVDAHGDVTFEAVRLI